MIPLKINGKNLCSIFEPDISFVGLSDEQMKQWSIDHQMYPSEVKVTSETYSKDAERKADFELEKVILTNAKAKPEFTWSYLRADYASRLLIYLGFTYNYKDVAGEVVPKEALPIAVTYWDFNGMRTIQSYLGQTIEGTLVEHATTVQTTVYSYTTQAVTVPVKNVEYFVGPLTELSIAKNWIMASDAGNQLRVSKRSITGEIIEQTAASKVVFTLDQKIQVYSMIDEVLTLAWEMTFSDYNAIYAADTYRITIQAFVTATTTDDMSDIMDGIVSSSLVTSTVQTLFWEEFRIAFPER